LGLLYQGTRNISGKDKQFFWLGLAFKVFCTFGFVLVYTVVYDGGDTFGYYRNGSVFYEVCLDDPSKALKLFFWEKGDISFWLNDIVHSMRLYGSLSFGTIIQLSGLVGLFTFNNFFCTSILFGFFSFIGMWAFYRVFTDMYPDLKTEIFLAALLFPSVVFWSSGIMKDSVTQGCMGLMFYGFYFAFIKKQHRLFSLLILAVATYLIWRVKFYIAVCLLPAFACWFYFHHLQMLRERSFRILITGSLIVVALIGGMLFAPQVQLAFSKGLTVFVEKAIDFQGWHGHLTQSGQAGGYSLGEMDFSLVGILSKVPISIATCYYRPLLTEVTSPVSLVSAIETLMVLFYTIYVLFRVGIFKTIKLVFTNHIIFSLLIFVLLFGFVVGFTSYNFGSLVRYRIPSVPVYFLVLFLLQYYAKKPALSPSRAV